MNTFKVPELPSLEEMVDARNKFMLTQPENQQYFIGLHLGKLDFRRKYAKPLRDALLIAVEHIERMGCGYEDEHSTHCSRCMTLDKITEILKEGYK